MRDTLSEPQEHTKAKRKKEGRQNIGRGGGKGGRGGE